MSYMEALVFEQIQALFPPSCSTISAALDVESVFTFLTPRGKLV